MESNAVKGPGGCTLDGTVDLRGRPVLASQTGKWKACAFLVTYEVLERMAYYGVASNLVVCLTTHLHEDTVSSVRNVNNWSGAVWMTPILGAYVADAYLGRFWTFTLSSIVYLLGMVMLTMAVSLKSMKPSCKTSLEGGTCVIKATPTQIGVFYTALYIIAVGAGGTKPNISTFGADQFDSLEPQEKALKASFFNWWMFSAFLGGLLATLGLVYIQENYGWGLGYAIPTAALMLSMVIFYGGCPFYRHKPKPKAGSGSTSDVVGVVLGAVRNWRVRVPTDGHTSSRFRFLDKAADKPPCYSEAQVEKTKLILGMLIIWFTTLIPSIIWAQVNTLFVKQGTTLDRRLGGHFKIPAASLSSFVTLSMLVAVPVYDRYFVPMMRNRTKNPRGITLLQRLTVGIIIQIFAIFVAYLVELRRMRAIEAHGLVGPKDTVPMSIMWLLPQYVMLGIGDIFNAIGLLEFFYDQSPDDMQSLGTTFFTSSIGVGNFLNSLLVTVVDRLTAHPSGQSWIGNNLNHSHLDRYYAFLLVIAIVNLGLFLWASALYVYKGDNAKSHVEQQEASLTTWNQAQQNTT